MSVNPSSFEKSDFTPVRSGERQVVNVSAARRDVYIRYNIYYMYVCMYNILVQGWFLATVVVTHGLAY